MVQYYGTVRVGKPSGLRLRLMLVGAMVRATYFEFRRSLPSAVKIDPLVG